MTQTAEASAERLNTAEYAGIRQKALTLPVVVGRQREGYLAGHDNNPAMVAVGGNNVEVRLLSVRIPTIAARIKEGRFSAEVFLADCLAPERSAQNPHEVRLNIKSDGERIDTSVSVMHLLVDEQDHRKFRWVDSLPSIVPDLAEAGVEPGRFVDALGESLGSPRGVRMLLNPQKEQKPVEKPRETDKPLAPVGDFRLAPGNRIVFGSQVVQEKVSVRGRNSDGGGNSNGANGQGQNTENGNRNHRSRDRRGPQATHQPGGRGKEKKRDSGWKSIHISSRAREEERRREKRLTR